MLIIVEQLQNSNLKINYITRNQLLTDANSIKFASIINSRKRGKHSFKEKKKANGHALVLFRLVALEALVFEDLS